ncbi:hypothetical protein V2J09_009477 [Rumex salicifolius]
MGAMGAMRKRPCFSPYKGWALSHSAHSPHFSSQIFHHHRRHTPLQHQGREAIASGDTISDLGRRVDGGAEGQAAATPEIISFLESEFDMAVAGDLESVTGGDIETAVAGDDVFVLEEGDVEVLRGILSDGERSMISTTTVVTVEEIFETADDMESEELGAVLEGGNAEVDGRPRTGKHPEFQPITVSAHKSRVLGVCGSSSGEDILEHDDAGAGSPPPPSEQPLIDDALPSIQEDVAMEEDVGVATKDYVRGTDDAHVPDIEDI